jgi:hypothetical protein
VAEVDVAALVEAALVEAGRLRVAARRTRSGWINQRIPAVNRMPSATFY